MWLLWAQYFCLSYGWYFYVTWLPTYLKDVRGMDDQIQRVHDLAGRPAGRLAQPGTDLEDAGGGAGGHPAVLRRLWLALRRASISSR